MSGLQRICKLYGGVILNGQRFVWDYAANKAVPESDMPTGSKRWRQSERAKCKQIQERKP